jgi:succinylglutamic semialdehyde dehydrogenase
MHSGNQSAQAILPANIIASRASPLATDGARVIASHDPAHPERIIWRAVPEVGAVAPAIAAARAAFKVWSRWPIERRAEALTACKALFAARVPQIADILCSETGKAMWEAEAEAKLLAAKIDTTLMTGAMSDGSGRARITDFEISLGGSKSGRCAFRPHGVMAVLGPFNFPAHLPNGHIVPALLAGNTIVFKPSDKTPAVGQLLAELFNEALRSAGAPDGVVNLVHGAADVAKALVGHDDLDGILFTGSWPVGRSIMQANLDRPGRIIALEMGGNNAAVVMPDCDLRQAVIECVRASFATTGQRCTCTRRLIVHESIERRFISAFGKATSNLLIGDPRGVGQGADGGPQPFYGPIIRAEARDAALKFQRDLLTGGGEALVQASAVEHPSHGHYISPGLVRVPKFSLSEDPARDCGCDMEVFAPIVRLSTCRDLDDALDQANASRFGLAASIFSKDAKSIERFLHEARAGCVNVNTGTAGASGKLPFGGLGHSGNHRPAGAFSLDYCAYPVASMIEKSADAPLSPGMRFEDSWL